MVCENNKIFHLHKFIISIDRNEHVLNGRLNFLNDQKWEGFKLFLRYDNFSNLFDICNNLSP